MIQLSVRWHVPEMRLELEHVFCRQKKTTQQLKEPRQIL